MQGLQILRRYMAAWAVLASCNVGVFAGGSAVKKEAFMPLPGDIVKVWRSAGAQAGWAKTRTGVLRDSPQILFQEGGVADAPSPPGPCR